MSHCSNGGKSEQGARIIASLLELNERFDPEPDYDNYCPECGLHDPDDPHHCCICGTFHECPGSCEIIRAREA